MRRLGSDFRTEELALKFATVARRNVATSRAVRAARGDAGLSQAELARRIGMSSSAIARAERGDHDTPVTTIGRIARELGVPLMTLLMLSA